MLVPDTKAGRALAEQGDKTLREVRFLPEALDVATASFIYADKVSLIMFNQKQPTAVLIEDTGIRETKAALFEELWSRSGDEEKAEPLLQKSGLFQVLADSSPQPLLIANEKIEIQYVNAAWEKQFGYTLEEVRGQNPRMLQSGKTPREVYERMWKTLKAGQPFQSDEIIDKKKDGKFFNLLTTIFPMRQGEKLHYVQILDDITKRKRVEAMRKNFLLAAVETTPAPFANIIKKLIDDSSFD
jgi:PAS domain S-box-containing protein